LYERKLAAAEKNLKKSVELQPTHAAYTNLGVLYYRQMRWAESANMTQKALQLNAKDWRGWLNLGLAYEWLNREADAAIAYEHQLDCLKELEKIKPDDAEVQAELGLLHSRKKLRRETLMYVEAALARAPKDPGVLASVAEAYEYLGERDRALDLVQQALANGWALEQLENDPGQRALVRDPRFREIARKYKGK
jgi:eukaryotic-like serine/threonine-protein kinase